MIGRWLCNLGWHKHHPAGFEHYTFVARATGRGWKECRLFYFTCQRCCRIVPGAGIDKHYHPPRLEYDFDDLDKVR